MTAPIQNNWLSGFEKLPPVPEEDGYTSYKLPDFKTPAGLNALSRGAVEGYRLH